MITDGYAMQMIEWLNLMAFFRYWSPYKPCNERCQGINSHGTDLVILEYSSVSIRED